MNWSGSHQRKNRVAAHCLHVEQLLTTDERNSCGVQTIGLFFFLSPSTNKRSERWEERGRQTDVFQLIFGQFFFSSFQNLFERDFFSCVLFLFKYFLAPEFPIFRNLFSHRNSAQEILVFQQNKRFIMKTKIWRGRVRHLLLG